MAFFYGIGTVEHVPGSPEEGFEPGRSQAVRVYDVNWESRFHLAKALLGRSFRALSEGGVSYIHRQLPHAHPEAFVFPETDLFPLRGYLWATKVIRIQGLGFRSKNQTTGVGLNVDGGGGVNHIATYDKARLTVQYTTLSYDVLSDDQTKAKNALLGLNLLWPDESTLVRYVTKNPRPAGSIVTLPQGFYKRVPHGTIYPTVHGINKPLVHCNFEVTWHHVPEVCVPLKLINPLATDHIANCMGRVNNYPFVGYAPGKLLLTGVELRPEIDPFGYRNYDIKYMIKLFNPTTDAGHNHIFQPFPAGETAQTATTWVWAEVTSDGTTNLAAYADGKSIFDWYDFRSLFRPSP